MFYLKVTALTSMCLTIWNRRALSIYSTVLNAILNQGRRILSFGGFHGVASWTDSFALLYAIP